MLRFPELDALRCGACLLAFTVAGCFSAAKPDTVDPTKLRESLSATDGRFSWSPEQNHYVYSKRQALVDAVIAQTPNAARDRLPEGALAGLADCIDDASPSASVLADKPAPLGWVCHAALTSFIYHEEVDAEGDVVPNWAGYPALPATPSDMQAAKAAWQKVLQTRQYSFQ